MHRFSNNMKEQVYITNTIVPNCTREIACALLNHVVYRRKNTVAIFHNTLRRVHNINLGVSQTRHTFTL